MHAYCFRLVLAVVLSLGLLWTPPAMAGGTTISIKYAGTGIDTALERVPDGFLISVDDARGKGTFGDSTIAITAEFAPMGLSCEEGPQRPSGDYDKFALIYSAAVITFPDLSQLLGVSDPMQGDPDLNEGWLCLDDESGVYFGQVDGLYVGGTGRFEGATGIFSSPFGGQFLDPLVGFRSITGSVQATVSMR
jgi:hypothetical protein